MFAFRLLSSKAKHLWRYRCKADMLNHSPQFSYSKRLRTCAMRCSFPLASWLHTWKADTCCMLGGSPERYHFPRSRTSGRHRYQSRPDTLHRCSRVCSSHTHQIYVGAYIHGLFFEQNLALVPYTVAL